MAGDIIGIVKSAQGVVDVRGPNGKIRSLLVGDELREGDTVLTTGGGQLVIALSEGGQLAIEPGQVVAMTAELSADRFPGADESQVASVDQIVLAVLSGKNLDEMLEATAAGPAGAAGTNEGHSFVQLLRITEGVGEVSGNTTAGLGPGSLPEIVIFTPVADEPTPPTANPDTNADSVVEAGVGPGNNAPNPGNPTATGNVLDNDTGPDSNNLVVVAVGGQTVPAGGSVTIQGTYGTLVVNSDGTYTYTLNNADGDTDSLAQGDSASEPPVSYTIVDENGNTASSTVTITITGTNDRPEITAAVDSGTVTEDAADPTLSTSGTIGFDDVDLSDAHTASVVASESNPLGGTLTATVTDAATGAGGGTVTWTYTIDNAATQFLAEGETREESFTVTITDSYGATRTEVVTVTVVGTNDVPVIETNPGNPGGALDVVYEAGLPDGSGVGSTTVTAGGTFTVSDVDGLDDLQSVTINGTTIALGDLVGSTIEGANGTLTITGFENGVATYAYELTSPTTDGPGTESDVFTVTTSDGSATSAPANIVIDIVDDGPVARDDADSVTEDGASIASGNVLTGSGGNDANATDGVADTAGADGVGSVAFTGAMGSTVAGLYGTLTVAADGSYTYTLNNANPAVQALDPGQTLTENFGYVLTDGDGDTDSATLTITIDGSNDKPTISTDPGDGNDFVFEAGLPDGSGVGQTVTLAEGTFTVGDGDGLADLQTVTINGTSIAIADLVGRTVEGDHGTLTITGFSDGVATYEYQLTSATTDGPGAETDEFSFTVSDGTTTSDPASITIEIVDDQPIARDDADSVSEDGATVANGNVFTGAGGNDANAADGVADTAGADGLGSIAWTGAQGSTIGGVFGTLTVGADGSYTYTLDNGNAAVQALDSGETLTENFGYVLTDGDGDSDGATLTITINGSNDKPTIETDPGNPGGARDCVYEAGLPDGSGVGHTTTVVGGTITVADPDGLVDIKSITINGTTIAIGNLVGSTIAGDSGTLTVTGYNAATGVATYEYELTSATFNGPGKEQEIFTLTTSDGTATSDPANITIDILDDKPIARDDADSVTEDGPIVADGNVFSGAGGNDANATDGTADTAGADGFGSVTWTGAVGNIVVGTYGTLTVGADGSYTYTLNNALPAVQALDPGQTLTENFGYVLTDGDPNGSDGATLVITINGGNDGPKVEVDPGNPGGANDIVYEAGLLDGSGVGPTTITVGGTFSVSDEDGLADIQSVTIDGTTIAIGNLGTGNAIVGDHGTLTITGYDAATGVATYSYTLTDPATDGAGIEADTFTITASDGTSSSLPANIVIEIADDLPVARDDADSVTEDGATVANGNVFTGNGGNDANNTDGVADTAGADGMDSLAWNGAVGNTVAGTYGTLTVNANGSYTYTLNNALPAVQALDPGQTLTENFGYVVTDGDGDADPATLVITVNGTNDKPTIDVDPGNPGGANDIVYEAGLPAGSGVGPTTVTVGGTFTLGDGDGLADLQSVTINGTTIAIGNLGTGNTIVGPNGTLTITAYDAATGVATYSYTLTSPATDVAGTENNTFTITTSDGTNASDPASIVITITDDLPIARDDADSVAEDGVLIANGNVLTGVGGNDANATDGVADTAGADGVDSLSWNGAVGNTVAGTYGTLTVNANGSYTYTLNNGSAAVQGLDAGQTLTENFGYVLTDGDGDADPATLVITINGTNDKPTIDTNSGNPGGANDIVYEAGLPAGSGVGPTTVTAGGTITLADADGLDDLQSVTINGTTIAIGNLVGSSVAGANGTLTITAYNAATGVATYSYLLTSPAADVAGTETNTFTVSTSDGTVSSDPANIVITIADDLPIARDDADSVTEDGATIANGNVLTGAGGNDANNTDGVADTAGADGVGSLTWNGAVGNTVAGTYGTLTVNVDGSYTYTLSNALAAVQGLDAGETLTENFGYVLTDGDGDADPATLVVTINGTNDKPTVVTDPGNPGGANDIVYEAGLPAGTGVGPTTVTVGGTITLADTDGLDDIKSVTINGTTILMANLVGSTVAAANGTLTITGYTNGVATYSYTLTSPATDGAGTETNTFTVTTSDGTVASDPASIVIDIVDDVPTIVADNLAIANVAGTFSGSFNFDVGADTLSFAQSFDSANALTWTNPRDGFSFTYDAATQTGTATFNDGTGTQTFFTVKLNANGTYDFNLVTPDPVTIVNIDSLLAGIAGGSGLPSYTFPASNFDGQFQLVMTGYTNNGATPGALNISSSSLGVDDNVIHGNKDDLLRFDVQPVGGSEATVSSLTIHVDGSAGWKDTDQVSATVHYTDGTTGTLNVTWGADQSATFTFDPSKTIDYLDITPVGTAAFKIDGVSMGYTAPSFPDDYQLNFNVTGDDADGDTVTDGFSVAVNTTDTATYEIHGTTGADTLYGTSGSDTFVWGLADHGSAGNPVVDRVVGFQAGVGMDVLDLRDLLVADNPSSPASLDNYLHFTQSGGTTTVEISTTGGFSGGYNAAAVDQKIELQGVDLTAGGTLADQQIIQNLLTAGNLHQ